MRRLVSTDAVYWIASGDILIFLRRGTAPERRHRLVDDTVHSKPVSTRNSLLTGKFASCCLWWAGINSNSPQNWGFLQHFPYPSVTGNFETNNSESIRENRVFGRHSPPHPSASIQPLNQREPTGRFFEELPTRIGSQTSKFTSDAPNEGQCQKRP
jgi:hypothetical protein